MFTVSDLRPGETVFPRKTVSVRKWRGQFLKEEKLYLVVERGGAQCVLYAGNNAILLFNNEAEVTYFCRKHNLELVEEKKGGEMMKVTEANLRQGETVYLREHSEGGWCLLVERDGSTHTVMMYNDDRPRRFDSRWEAWSYCQHYRFVLEGWDNPVPEAESQHHHIPNRGERELLPVPEDNLPLPPIPPEWEEVIDQALVEVTKRKAANDLGELTFLIRERERSRAELERRKRRGKRSCVCSHCIRPLEDEIADVDAKASQILLWWFDAFDTSPGDVVAGRWQPDKTPC